MRAPSLLPAASHTRTLLGGFGLVGLVGLVAASCTATVRDFGAGGGGTGGGGTGGGGAGGTDVSASTDATGTTGGPAGGGSTTSTGTVASTTSGSASHAASSSNASGSSSSGGATGGCVAGSTGFAGALCGPTPCKIAQDTVIAPSAARTDAPSIALSNGCDPSVAYAVSDASANPSLATRNADTGTWTSALLPFAASSVGVRFGSVVSSKVALTDTGADWLAIGGGNWSLYGNLTGTKPAAFATSVQLTGTQIEVGYLDGTSVNLETIPYGGQSSTVTLKNVSGEYTVATDLSPKGVLNAAYFAKTSTASGAVTTTIGWATPTITPETVATLATGAAVVTTLGFTVVPSADASTDGTPYVFFQQGVVLQFAHRTATNTWVTQNILANALGSDDTCTTTTPTKAGQTCVYHTTTVEPRVAVSTLAGARFVFQQTESKGTKTATCAGTTCTWTGTTDATSGMLVLAWVDPDGYVQTQLLVSKTLSTRATAVVDNAGRIHLAFYDTYPLTAAGVSSGRQVRYLMVSP